MSHNIYLTGFSGSGKSTVGKALSFLTGQEFVDIDLMIEEIEQKPIPDIFNCEGEEYFRAVETDCLKKISNRTNLIVSTGGGLAVDPVNVEAMENSGCIIWLKASPETILERLNIQNENTGIDNDRPMLISEEPLERIKKLLDSRQDAYKRSHAIVETDRKNVEVVAEEIHRRLVNWEK
ncbi:MAG: shikimate kinase [SAR202 cluster bacterium]|jgi:shikimate kinase|nr:shikimate kinase [SAR202 cluster bacterium]HJO60695.1 shikimate kinase [SAR202 cluster bacterium]|tara:strand:- start:15740 stop:16276 length:537 start_codon:yes stop_codon:yes gene_type:complete